MMPTSTSAPANLAAVPPRPPRHRVPIARSYLRELAVRCRAVGLQRVADAAVPTIHINTLRRTLAGDSGRNPTLDTIAAVNRALGKLGGRPMPPPVVAVKSDEHYQKIALAERLDTVDLVRIDRKRRRK